jgi:hypothetical protein
MNRAWEVQVAIRQITEAANGMLATTRTIIRNAGRFARKLRGADVT